jgi:hypothetical protein
MSFLLATAAQLKDMESQPLLSIGEVIEPTIPVLPFSTTALLFAPIILYEFATNLVPPLTN